MASEGRFGLGLAPTAITIVTAVTTERGANPRSLLVGAFLVDIANAMTIQALIAWLAR